MRTMVRMIGLVLAGGCFTDPGGTGGPATTEPGTSTGAASTGTGTSTGAPTSTEPGTSTGTDTGTSTGTGSSGSTGSSSTGEPTGTTTMGEGAACDPWAQDCDEGLKCAPYADDGGNAWNANKCTPAGEGSAGGPCIAMGSATSGYDTCKAGAICWEVDPDTLAGVCYAVCEGSPNTPLCTPGSACFITNGGSVNVCLISCDPLLSKCDAGQVCVPDDDGQFLCLLAADKLPVGESCGFRNECVSGSMCADASKSTKVCDQNAVLCCTAYCDLKNPDCLDGLDCVPYFADGEAPPELATLGLCQDPV